MIRKPNGVEQESRLHAAVGTAIDKSAGLREAKRNIQKAQRKVGLYYIFGMLGFGLLFSSTPIWFKLIVAGIGYWLFKAWKDWTARQDLKADRL